MTWRVRVIIIQCIYVIYITRYHHHFHTTIKIRISGNLRFLQQTFTAVYRTSPLSFLPYSSNFLSIFAYFFGVYTPQTPTDVGRL